MPSGVTVVIPNWNKADLLDRALASLASGRARPLLWTGAGALASAPLAFAWSVVAWLARSG